MAEEVKDAATAVPRAMIAVYLINMALIFPAVLTVCYHIPDVTAALEDPTTYPAIYVLRQSMSTAWMLVVLVIICLLNVASNIAYLAAVSSAALFASDAFPVPFHSKFPTGSRTDSHVQVTRDLFAFARDKGVPFSAWLSAVDPEKHVPLHATYLSTVVSILLALIYIGSPLAFYSITSLL